MKPVIINDLDEYKNLICGWVRGVELGCKWREPSYRLNLQHIQELAEGRYFDAPFVFQDEDARHFNHDIEKECANLLTH